MEIYSVLGSGLTVISFVIFIGIFFPAVAALAYLALRHFLPGPTRQILVSPVITF